MCVCIYKSYVTIRLIWLRQKFLNFWTSFFIFTLLLTISVKGASVRRPFIVRSAVHIQFAEYWTRVFSFHIIHIHYLFVWVLSLSSNVSPNFLPRIFFFVFRIFDVWYAILNASACIATQLSTWAKRLSFVTCVRNVDLIETANVLQILIENLLLLFFLHRSKSEQ